MAEQFGVTPDELRSVSGDLHEVSSRVKQVIATLRGQIAGEGAGASCAIAPGDSNSFRDQYDHVEGSIDPADTSVLDYWADYLKRAADVFQQSDESLGLGT
jgi:hypothetical protein